MGIEYQQNLAARNLVVLVLQAKSSRLEDLRPLIPRIDRCLSRELHSLYPN